MERCPRRLQEQCPRRMSKRGCEVIVHHAFHPRSRFEEHSELAAQFRELPINKIPMCKQQEIELHDEESDGVEVPPVELMQMVVDNEMKRRRLAVREIRRP